MDEHLMDRDEVKKAARKDYIKKGYKTQNQFASNQTVQTIEEPAYNESAFESKKKLYDKS